MSLLLVKSPSPDARSWVAPRKHWMQPCLRTSFRAAQQKKRAYCSLCFCLLQELHFKNRYWHDTCFKCFKCYTSLVNEPFMLRENNKVWCSNCTATEDAPRCKGCFKPIIAGTGTSNTEMNAECCSRAKPWRLKELCRLQLGASQWKSGELQKWHTFWLLLLPVLFRQVFKGCIAVNPHVDCSP